MSSFFILSVALYNIIHHKSKAVVSMDTAVFSLHASIISHIYARATFKNLESVKRHITAFKVVINIVCDESCLEFAVAANRIRRSQKVKILGKNKFDAANRYIAAGLSCVCRNCHGFHSALIFVSAVIHLMQQHSKRSALMRINIPLSDIRLHNTSKRFHSNLTRIKFHRIDVQHTRHPLCRRGQRCNWNKKQKINWNKITSLPFLRIL